MPRGNVLPDGHKIRLLRGEADLTQWQMAEQAGYALRTIGKIEDGRPTGARTLDAIATVLARRLQRSVKLSDLINRSGDGDVPATGERSIACVDQAVKLLDLSDWRPRSGNSRAPVSCALLHDHYRFRSVPPGRAPLTFRYATTGDLVDGISLSHRDDFEWHDLGECGDDPVRRNHCYEMRIHIERRDGGVEVHNRLEYVNAFSNPEHEWFHTHLVHTTGCLMVLALFPESKLCRAARGVSRRHATEPFAAALERPLLLHDGRLVQWHVRAPQAGADYQLEWDW
jgi:DNA-binding XRE family transcriptional regulator